MNVKIHGQVELDVNYDRIGKVTICAIEGQGGVIGKGVAIKNPRDNDFPALAEYIAHGRALRNMFEKGC